MWNLKMARRMPTCTLPRKLKEATQKGPAKVLLDKAEEHRRKTQRQLSPRTAEDGNRNGEKRAVRTGRRAEGKRC